MARSLLVPGVGALAAASILSLFVVISLPTVDFFDVVRVSFATRGSSPIKGTVSSVRWGIWGWCYEQTGSDDFSCKRTGVGYEVILGSVLGGSEQSVGASYTRGLVVHAIAFACTIIALGFALSEHLFLSLLASLLSFLAALLSLVALAIDIALYARVHAQSNDLKGVKPNTDFGPAFWMTLVSIIACLAAGVTVCFNRRKDADSYSYPMLEQRPWYRRFGHG